MRYLKFCVPVLLILFMVSSADALGTDPYHDQSVPSQYLTGSVSVGAGLTGVYGYSNLVLSWVITPGEAWEYQYTFSGFSTPAIGAFILELSNDCVFPKVNGTCVQGVNNAGYAMFIAPSDLIGPNAGSSITGVKLLFGGGGPSYTYTFYSDRQAVYGDFYVFGGDITNYAYAYNIGLNNSGLSDPIYFIPRPDGSSQVPEPAVLLLLGVGLVAIAIWGFMKRRKKT